MKPADYRAMVHAQNQSYMNAWYYIFSNWHSVEWQPVPVPIKITLSLHGSIGMCNGQLVTRTGANGMSEFIQRMNRVR